MNTELDTEIRRAVAELADAAPLAPTFDELSDGSLAAGRPLSRRSLVTAGAAVLAAAAMIAVLVTVRMHDGGRPGLGESSTIAEPQTTTRAQWAVIDGPVLPGDAVAYGPAATSWLATVEASLPTGFHAVVAWESSASDPEVLAQAVDAEGRVLRIRFAYGGGAALRRQVDGVGDPAQWATVPEGDIQSFPGDQALVTTSGDAIGVGCQLGARQCDGPRSVADGVLETFVRRLASTADLAALHMVSPETTPMVECNRIAQVPELYVLHQSVVTVGQSRLVSCSFDDAQQRSITVHLDLRSAAGGTQLGVGRASVRNGVVVGQASSADAFITTVGESSDGAPLDDASVAPLIDLVDKVNAGLAAESGPITAAVNGTSPPDTVPDPAPTVSTAPPATNVVQPGDYVVGIASANKVPLAALLAANEMTASSLIVPGQSLTLPAPSRPMVQAVDAGVGLPDTFQRSLPPGLLLRQGTFRGADGRIVILGAGSADDARQVTVWIVPGGEPSTTPRPLGIVDDRPSSRAVEWVGPTGLLYGARAVDLDGGAAPLTIDEIQTVLDKVDVNFRAVPAGAALQAVPTTNSTTSPTFRSAYVVVAGDYLLGIAKKLGVPLSSLLDANGMTTSSPLAVGQRLVLPPGAPPTASAVAERTALDKSGQHFLDPMSAPLDGSSSIIGDADAVAVTVRRVGDPPTSVSVSVLLGAYVDTTSTPTAAPRLAYAVVYTSACTTASSSGAVVATPQACTGATTVVDAVTGDVIAALSG